MNTAKRRLVTNGFVLVAFPLFLLTPLSFSADDQNDPMRKALGQEAGKMNNQEKTLYEQSIRSTKQGLAKEMLDTFYRDALDYYHQRNYDLALETLDRISSADPTYPNVRSLRETILRLKASADTANARETIGDLMQRAEAAQQSGQDEAAQGYYKQVLTLNPKYEVAKRKLKDLNRTLAQREFDEGYLRYQRGDMQGALESWSYAISKDPSLRQRSGVMPLIAKIELNLRRTRISELAAQGDQQFSKKDYAGALSTYQNLLVTEPRNQEAQHRAAKLKILLAQQSADQAKQLQSKGQYDQAIREWQKAIEYGFAPEAANRGVEAAKAAKAKSKEVRAPKVSRPKTTHKSPPPPKKAPDDANPSAAGDETATVAPAATPGQPAAPVNTTPANPAEALTHYRQGLAAIRANDYHRAVEELEVAAQLDPTNVRIITARDRARQEWGNINNGK